MPRPRRLTDEQLIEAVAAAASWHGVGRALGLSAGGRTYAVLRARAADLGLDLEHLPGLVDGRPRTRRRFSDDQLRDAVATCVTFADVMRALGYEPSGGMHRYIRAHVRRLGLDTSHFVGQAWMRGRPNPNAFRRRPIEELLVDGSSIGGASLLRRLVAEGLKERCCERCSRTTWEGQPIPLELDHVNGVPSDNRIANLRVLCPNCHALTPTYCGRKNRGRVVEPAYTRALGVRAERLESSNLSAPT